MNKRAYIVRTMGIMALAVTFSACATTRQNTSTEEEEQVPAVIWFTDGLQKKGVFVKEDGLPYLGIPADESQRLLLNGREVVDVFVFDDEDRAKNEAYQFAGLYPQNDVYIKEALVVVRYTERDTGLTLTLHDLLGVTL